MTSICDHFILAATRAGIVGLPFLYNYITETDINIKSIENYGNGLRKAEIELDIHK